LPVNYYFPQQRFLSKSFRKEFTDGSMFENWRYQEIDDNAYGRGLAVAQMSGG
jgi:hypothetical protein